MTLRPDAQAFDEIRIVTVPRWKESELSGDEWRISATIEFYRKGILKEARPGFRNVETAAGCLYRELQVSEEMYFGSCETEACDQEGCSAKATVKYRLKAAFCREGHKTEPPPLEKSAFRQFCERHKHRGDCGLDDADGNYAPA